MAMHVERAPRLLLPQRVQVRRPLSDTVLPRIELAERIADFANIVTVDDTSGTCPGGVELFFTPPVGLSRKRPEPRRFCRIDNSGIRIPLISDWDKYQLISRRWGILDQDEVLLFLPRSSHEVNICWTILSRAYDFLTEEGAADRQTRSATMWNLPHYSRSRFH